MEPRVRITDVSPRDGLQNEPGVISTADKLRLVEALCSTGVDEIEVSSFVSAKWVPQLGDAADLLERVAAVLPADGPMLSALVPNERGMVSAIEANRTAARVDRRWERRPLLQKVAVFTAASETFSQKNTNASIAETLKRFEPVIALARQEGLQVRGYVSCVIECPFEGKIEPQKVSQVAQALHDMGCDEIDLGDTIGAAEPETITLLMHGMLARLGDDVLQYTTLHLHDTFGRAAECVAEALAIGVRSFDGAVSGIGGCPYATVDGRRAPGNISTELLVETVHAAGFETGVDCGTLQKAGLVAAQLVKR